MNTRRRFPVEAMLSMHAEGLSYAEIGRRLGCTTKHVSLRIRKATGVPTTPHVDEGLWGYDDDRKRREFATRAARGAREALDTGSFVRLGMATRQIVADVAHKRKANDA